MSSWGQTLTAASVDLESVFLELTNRAGNSPLTKKRVENVFDILQFVFLGLIAAPSVEVFWV